MLSFSQGDTAVLNLTITDGGGAPQMLQDDAVLTTKMKGPRGIIVSFPSSQHTILDQMLFPGQFTLALSTSDTAACGVAEAKDVVTEVQQDGGTIYFHGNGILEVFPNYPLI